MDLGVDECWCSLLRDCCCYQLGCFLSVSTSWLRGWGAYWFGEDSGCWVVMQYDFCSCKLGFLVLLLSSCFLLRCLCWLSPTSNMSCFLVLAVNWCEEWREWFCLLLEMRVVLIYRGFDLLCLSFCGFTSYTLLVYSVFSFGNQISLLTREKKKKKKKRTPSPNKSLCMFKLP